MEEQIINFQTAKLAKEKGFNLECNRYNRIGTVYNDNSFIRKNDFDFTYPAPTQSLLQKWLREVHKTHINPILVVRTLGLNEFSAQKISWRYDIVMINTKQDERDKQSSTKYNSYEEALEAGLQEALKLIK